MVGGTKAGAIWAICWLFRMLMGFGRRSIPSTVSTTSGEGPLLQGDWMWGSNAIAESVNDEKGDESSIYSPGQTVVVVGALRVVVVRRI